MRIQNIDTLVSHGNVSDRKAVVEILEAGLVAADPYYHTKQLLRIENGKLILDGKDYEPYDDPRSGLAVFDLDELDDVYVLGAGKGIQRAAKAIEEVLGD